MTSTGSTGEFDALAEGISRGLDIAAGAALPQLDVAQSAYTLVSRALEQQGGQDPDDPQVELLAEFVTLALAAGVTRNHIDGWISDLCAKGAA
ncbi:MAG TPA: hypothetical protein VKS82_12045 [Streptosporangiaceae bacterium]|jgi:hypothetical protein|nr:hypothetical protein [Streptosporangiaceae bacterium]